MAADAGSRYPSECGAPGAVCNKAIIEVGMFRVNCEAVRHYLHSLNDGHKIRRHLHR